MRSKERLAAYGEIWTPNHIVREMHILVPDLIWSDPTLIYLEPSCGNGAFLIDIAQHRLSLGLKPLQVARNLIGVDLLKDNIQEARARLTEILGYPEIINKNLIQADFLEWVRKARKAFGYKGQEMPKTNNLVVFGNPPYQSEDGGFSRSAKPIYNLFSEAVVKHLNPRFHSFIIPSRWMLGGKGLDSFREWMLSGAPVNQEDKAKHISYLADFKGSTEVFPEVNIAGGVCYYLWDREHNGPCMCDNEVRKLDEYDVFIRDNEALSILRKIQFKHKAKWMNDVVSARKPYGFDADTVPTASGTPCWFKQSQGKGFVDPKIVKDPRNDLKKWKLLAPYTIPGADVMKLGMVPVEILHATNMIIAKPGECCTETYLVLNSLNSENEAKNFLDYVKTRFFRFMLLLRAVSQHITCNAYSFVPDLGDYSKPITDADLYKRFSLTPEEIAYIESKIKPLPRPVS